MRRPIVLLGALALVAGVEAAAFWITAEADPAAARAVVLGSCSLLILVWLLIRLAPGAGAPSWPPSTAGLAAVSVDPETRHLEALVAPDAPARYQAELARLLARHVPSDAPLSPGFARFVVQARAGGTPPRPSPAELRLWISELETTLQ